MTSVSLVSATAPLNADVIVIGTVSTTDGVALADGSAVVDEALGKTLLSALNAVEASGRQDEVIKIPTLGIGSAALVVATGLGKGEPSRPAEIKTPGRSGMRTGMLALRAPDASTLVAWKKDDRMGWQLYDAQGKPSGSPGSAKSSGNGVAGVVDKDGHFILFP